MIDVYLGAALTVFIIAIVFYIDVRAKYGKYGPRAGKKATFWSLDERNNHPIWAWLVSAILWTILICVGVGTVQYMLYGHHGPHFASKLGLEHHVGEEEAGILEQVIFQGKVEKHRHFHNLVEETTVGDKNPVCYLCHGNFPHKRRPFIRVLMNMHTQFLGCFTCHVSDDVPEKDITLKWFNYSENKPKGEPFGLSYDEETGRISETDDYYSKIIAFIQRGGKEQMLEMPEDSPIGLEYMRFKDKLAANPELQGQYKNRLHKNVSPKGRFCTRCHTSEKKSFIPFRKLGFTDQRVNDLTGLNIVGIVQKYKGFYIPSLYRGEDKEASEKDIKRLVGEDTEVRKELPSKKPVFDPKAWWKKNYIKKEEAPRKRWEK